MGNYVNIYISIDHQTIYFMIGIVVYLGLDMR